jgi:hypothetical protein
VCSVCARRRVGGVGPRSSGLWSGPYERRGGPTTLGSGTRFDTHAQDRRGFALFNSHVRVSGTHRRSTMISRSFERPERTARRANAATSRYRMRYMRLHDRPASPQVSAHDPIYGTQKVSCGHFAPVASRGFGPSGVLGCGVVVDCVARGAPDAVCSLGGVESSSLCGLA